MPIVTINMLEGRNKEKKKELIEKVSDTVAETLEIPMDGIRVILNEVPFDNYGVGGLPVKEYRVKKAGENHKNK